VISPRSDYPEQLEKYNFFYHNDDALEWSKCITDPYWGDAGQVEISKEAEVEIMQYAFELHNMILEAVEKVANDPVLMQLFGIKLELMYGVQKSWQNNQADL
jgi:glutathionylspermidine synthase